MSVTGWHRHSSVLGNRAVMEGIGGRIGVGISSDLPPLEPRFESRRGTMDWVFSKFCPWNNSHGIFLPNPWNFFLQCLILSIGLLAIVEHDRPRFPGSCSTNRINEMWKFNPWCQRLNIPNLYSMIWLVLLHVLLNCQFDRLPLFIKSKSEMVIFHSTRRRIMALCLFPDKLFCDEPSWLVILNH